MLRIGGFGLCQQPPGGVELAARGGALGCEHPLRDRTLALANFGNDEGLTDIGGSRLIESLDSGPPIIAAANSGNLGAIRASALEKSNVDLAQQFVNLIVGQRAFQANTRTVSVANELLSNLVSLGQ